MCGICGIYTHQGRVEREALQRMKDSLAHRGPDGEGQYLAGPIGMGSRMLSIIDIEGGQQPMSNEDGSIWIVFNGEIYNFRHLRDELRKAGHSFKTNSDTEVIIHLYEEYKEACVEKLRGMFAFAIWDENEEKLILARDRLGQKPIFYAWDGETLLFASEVKAILAANVVSREIDLGALHNYLSLRFIPSPATMFRDVRKLPPAHYMVVREKKLRMERYWNLSFREKLELNEDLILEGLAGKLTETVESHLISDVPLGAFLSGGMDSSVVVALMARASSHPIRTFSIGVREAEFNELPFAREVAGRYGTSHYEQYVLPNHIQILPEIIWHLDEPSDPIAACMFSVAELASRHVKAVLGGDGGDELFAGFDRYLGLRYLDRYAWLAALLRPEAVGAVINRLPENFAYKSASQRIRWLHQLSTRPSLGHQYAQATSFFRFSREDKEELFSESLWSELKGVDPANVIAQHFDDAPANDLVDRMLYTDIMTRLPEHSLMLTDRMTMAHGLEARAPFLDHELVEYVAALPSNLKIRGRQLKYALRKYAGTLLPERIVRRQKHGFMFPIAYWFKNQFNGFLKSSLLDSHLVKEGLFQAEAVSRLIQEHQSNEFDHHVRLWMLLNLEIWHEIYVGRSVPASVALEMEKRMSPLNE